MRPSSPLNAEQVVLRALQHGIASGTTRTESAGRNCQGTGYLIVISFESDKAGLDLYSNRPLRLMDWTPAQADLYFPVADYDCPHADVRAGRIDVASPLPAADLGRWCRRLRVARDRLRW